MHIKFKKIEIHSFLSFSDESFNLDNANGLNLIRGKNNDNLNDANECGKSNLWKALTYSLFGDIPNSLKKNENLVNSYVADKDMKVSISFDVDFSSYIIVRGMNKGKNSYLNLFKIENNEELDITKSSIAETQKLIEEDIIHCDMTMFLRTIFLTNDQNYNFYLLKKADKKEFVEKLFDISVFGDMYSLIHKDLNQIDKDILSKQNRLIVLNNNEVNYKNLQTKYENDRKEKISSIQKSIEDNTKKLESLKKIEINSNDDVVKKFKAAIFKLENAKEDIRKKLRNIQVEISKESLNKNNLKSSREQKKSLIAKHSDVLEKLCSDCKDIFKKHYSIDQYIKDINKIDKDILKIEENENSYANEKNSLTKKLEEYNIKSQKAIDKISELTSEYTKVQKDISYIESTLNNLNSSLNNLLVQENPYSKILKTNSVELEKEQTSLNELEQKHIYLKYSENIVSQDTLRKFIIKDLVVLLNNRIKTYLTKLGAKYYVNFNEDMDHTFITDKGNWEFNNFSAGGRMRIMIATSFAFRDFMQIRNGLTSNILILDEYFDSAISSNCIENVLSILQEYSSKMKQNIFIISHRPEMNQDVFDRVIYVEKTNNISKIVIK